MKKVFSITIVAALAMSFQFKTETPQPTDTKLALTTNSSSRAPITISTGTYIGTVPCVDCEGIQMKLTLKEGKAGKGKTFLLEQTYLGKPAGSNVVRIKGIWIPARGNKQDPKAVVIQLIPDGNYDPLYFLRLNDNAIKMLDRKQSSIKSKHNYMLQKQRG